MSKNFFCEKCGEVITVKRRALKNRQEIVELVSVHTCNPDKDFTANITDTETKPNSFQKVLREIPTGPSLDDLFNDLSGDKRDKKNLHETVTTAPRGIVEQVKLGLNSTPEGDINDMP